MDVRYAGARPVALRAALSRGPLAIGVAAAQVAIVYVGTTLLSPLYRLYQQEFGFSKLTLTAVYAAYLVGNLCGLLLLGRLSDQVGRRLVNLAALGGAAVATVLYMLASSTAWLFAGRIVSGLAIAVAATAATAWVAELAQDQQSASVYTTCGNFAGLALGALLAGLLATYLPHPFELSYLVYLVLLAGMALLVARLRETVKRPVRSVGTLSVRPRLGVPRELLGAFLAPAAVAFASFAVIGYYAALIPSVMAESLGVSSPASGGAVIALLMLVGAVLALLARGLSSRAAMLSGAALLLPALILLPCAQGLHSMPLLICGTVVAGAATVLGYRGSLQVVSELAPADGRAGMISSYILVAYCANALPVLGIGVLGAMTSSLTADITFACINAALAALALTIGALRQRPARGGARSDRG